VGDRLAGQRARQRPADRLADALRYGLRGNRRRRTDFELLERQLQLGNLGIELFTGTPKARAAQPRNLQLQLLDQQFTILQLFALREDKLS
jgi:hypothetical protein